MSGYIAENAIIRDSTFSEEIRLYRNAVLSASKCASGVSIGDDTTVERCVIGRHVALNRRSYFNDSTIGDYSYAGINTTMNFAKVGKFCSIARNVDIGGFDHDYHKVTTMPLFRMRQMLFNEKPTTSHNEYCIIGNDVWIAAGAQILHKVTVGDGAVIGGGAVVTKDIPPYAIAVGVPARVIKYRFNDATISALLEIKWWDWPEEVLLKNIDWLIASDVTPEVLALMRAISEEIKPA